MVGALATGGRPRMTEPPPEGAVNCLAAYLNQFRVRRTTIDVKKKP